MDKLSTSQQTSAMLAGVWNKNRETLLHRMDSIERLCSELPGSASNEALRQEALNDAHKLAGSLGMFGLAEGTRVARAIEHHLKDDGADELREADIPSLARSLRSLIEFFEIPEERAKPERRNRVLIVESDPGVAEQIRATANKRGMDAWVAADLQQARKRLHDSPFELLILDLGTAELTGTSAGDDYAEQMRELILSRAPMQVLALTSMDRFEDRVTAAQVGAHGFLPKNVPVSEIVDTCEHLLDLRSTEFKVLIVDDDRMVLKSVKNLLEQQGIHVSSLSDPRMFWNTLQETAPDLVILDLEMPNFSGLELCRAIRNDAHWNRLPVLFLSARTEPEMVTSIFAAGADDFVPKPIIDVELTTRVRNRLDRDRLYRTLSDYDQLTGVRNRRSSNVVIANYLRLAERHGLPVSLAIVDLDKFKRVNDTYGHQAGDDVLQYFGGLLRQSFRSEDVVARWGGEEFVIAMFAMQRSDAMERLAAVLERVEGDEFKASSGTRFRVTFSAGVAEFPVEARDLHSLYRLADEALYRAKATGGQRIYSMAAATAADRGQVDIAIVSRDVTVSAPLRHTVEMRGYSVDLYQKTDASLQELYETHPRIVLLDDSMSDIMAEVVARLRDGDLQPAPAIFILSANQDPMEAALEGLERIAKPYKSAWLMQRLRRALAE